MDLLSSCFTKSYILPASTDSMIDSMRNDLRSYYICRVVLQIRV